MFYVKNAQELSRSFEIADNSHPSSKLYMWGFVEDIMFEKCIVKDSSGGIISTIQQVFIATTRPSGQLIKLNPDTIVYFSPIKKLLDEIKHDVLWTPDEYGMVECEWKRLHSLIRGEKMEAIRTDFASDDMLFVLKNKQ